MTEEELNALVAKNEKTLAALTRVRKNTSDMVEYIDIALDILRESKEKNGPLCDYILSLMSSFDKISDLKLRLSIIRECQFERTEK